jgi:hypothetical protein
VETTTHISEALALDVAAAGEATDPAAYVAYMAPARGHSRPIKSTMLEVVA